MVIDGKKIAGEILDRLKARLKPEKFLAAVLVGDDKSSVSFIAQKEKIAKQLTQNIAAFAKLARFDTPFIAGEQFTLADCAAITHLPVLGSATKVIYGRDFLAEQLAARDYLKRMNQRPHVQTVNADRKLNTELMLKRY